MITVLLWPAATLASELNTAMNHRQEFLQPVTIRVFTNSAQNIAKRGLRFRPRWSIIMDVGMSEEANATNRIVHATPFSVLASETSVPMSWITTKL
jgi:hypothetical protein